MLKTELVEEQGGEDIFILNGDVVARRTRVSFKTRSGRVTFLARPKRKWK